MRATVDIPDDLYQQAESKAAREGVPMGHFIAQALRAALGHTPLADRQRVSLPLHHSSQPGTLSVEQIRAAEESAAQREDAASAGTL